MQKTLIKQVKVALLVGLATTGLSLGTYSCVSRQLKPTQGQNQLQKAQDVSWPIDSLAPQPASALPTAPAPAAVVAPNLLQRFFSRKAKTETQFAGGKIKIGRGAQVTLIQSHGDNNDIKPTQGKIDKNKAAAQVATDSSLLNAAQLKGNGQLTQTPGSNNAITPTNSPPKETSFLAGLKDKASTLLANFGGWLLGAGVVLTIVGVWYVRRRIKNLV